MTWGKWTTRILFGSFLTLAIGCSDDTKPLVDSRLPDLKINPDSPKPGDVGTKEKGTQEGGKPDTTAQKVDFSAIVEAFGSNPPANVPGVTVELYDNDTGAASGTTKTTDTAGKVTFPGLTKGKLYGFKMSLANFRTTLIWNLAAVAPSGSCTADADCGAGKKCDKPASTCVERLTVCPNTVYQMSLGLAQITAVAGKSMTTGAIYWVDSTGKDVPVGCAKVTAAPPTTDYRYMSQTNGLPTTLANQPCTSAVSPALGRFVAANLDVGQVTLTAKDSTGGTIGTSKIWSIADTIIIGNIYAAPSVTTNPTPATCACTP